MAMIELSGETVFWIGWAVLTAVSVAELWLVINHPDPTQLANMGAGFALLWLAIALTLLALRINSLIDLVAIGEVKHE